MILAIDPGNVKSGYVLWNGLNLPGHGILPNEQLLALIEEVNAEHLAVENVACYGMKVGRTVFDTCIWIGRYKQRWLDLARPTDRVVLVERKNVKMHLCGRTNIKDKDIVAALKLRFGDKGIKRNPGLTYGLKADSWQAFALGVYLHDTLQQEAKPVSSSPTLITNSNV